MIRRILILIISTMVTSIAVAQTDVIEIMESKIFVEHSNRTIINNSEDNVSRYFVGDVRMYHDSVYMFCDSAVIMDNKLTAVGNVVFVQSDTINVFADSLVYYSDLSMAYLYKNVTIENGVQQLFTQALVYNTAIKLATYQDTAIMRKGTITLQSIKGKYDINSGRAIFYNQVIVLDENMDVRTDSLEFIMDDNKVIFVKPTRIIEGERKIYCEGGFYNLESGQALFTGNPQFVENEKNAFAEEIHYIAEDSTVLLLGNAIYSDGAIKADANKIIYNSKDNITSLMGNAHFVDGSKESSGDTLIYYENEEAIKIKGLARVSDPPNILNAEYIDYEDVLGFGKARSNVIWKDTSANIAMFSDVLNYNNNDNSVIAIGTESRPYLVQNMNRDTMYLAADSLFSFERVIKDSLSGKDNIRYFEAYNSVNIIKSNLRANCDSLVYNDFDSLFTLYNNPIVWSDSTQFSGDTILMFLKNDQITKLSIREKSFIINQLEPEIYNQIKGKYIDVFFRNGDIDFMDVKANAESLYYMQDENKAYLGVNSTLCSHMRFLFKNKEIENIRFYTEPESVMIPAKEIDPIKQRLTNFNWLIDQAPINLQMITRKN